MISARRNFFKLVEKEGYILLNEYKDNNTTVILSCPNKEHPSFLVNPDHFIHGARCTACTKRSPKEQAIKDFVELVKKEGYQLLSEYINTETKVKLSCPNNKHDVYLVTPHSFKTGSRCPACSGRCPKRAKKDLLDMLKNEGYQLLSEYKNTTTKVKLSCPNPNHAPYMVAAITFRRGIRCPACSGTCPKQAKKDLLNIVEKEGYQLLSEYKNNTTKVKLSCPNPSHEPFMMAPSSFKTGQRCPVCSGRCPKRAKKDLLDMIEKEEYQLLSEYKNIRTKVKLSCPNPNHDPFMMAPTDFKQGKRCPACSGNCPKHAKREFIELVKEEGYLLLSEYKHAKHKVKISCRIQNHEPYLVTPNDFKTGYRCPICAKAIHDFRSLYGSTEHYNDPRVLYWLHMGTGNVEWYKIGLTTVRGGIKARYGGITKTNVSIIKEKTITLDNYTATLVEAYVKIYYQKYRSKDSFKELNIDSRLQGGTECFTHNLFENLGWDDLIKMAKDKEQEIIATLKD